MKTANILVLVSVFLSSHAFAFPFAPAAGQPGSTAIHKDDPAFVAWADGYTNVLYGSDLASDWKTPVKALGKAVGDSYDIVSLGRGGQIAMTFSQGIADGDGFDFAVFENGISDMFLELAWVEVSSDGIHFVRFPNHSYTADPVGAFGTVDPTYIHGLASKYRQGYGTPFDLSDLQAVSDAIANGTHSFTSTYVEAFANNYPYLDLSNVGHVRIVDIVGDGSAFDAEGFVIYDPYPTAGSAGFDLDAIGVINLPEAEGLPQQIAFPSIPHQQLAFGSVTLDASTDSGLPVSYAVQSGPATATNNLLFFSGTGTVEVVASQPGDATYAPAAPVLRSFVVAEEIQHIFVEPVPYQLQGGGPVQLNAYASSGLPVGMEVFSGPASVVVGATSLVLDPGSETGTVVLRAFQPGDATHAPANEVLVQFEIVGNGSTNAPVAMDVWFATHAAPALEVQMGTDAYGRLSAVLEFDLDLRAAARCRVWRSVDLSSWTNTIPEIVAQSLSGPMLNLRVRLPVDGTNGFFRLNLEEQ